MGWADRAQGHLEDVATGPVRHVIDHIRLEIGVGNRVPLDAQRVRDSHFELHGRPRSPFVIFAVDADSHLVMGFSRCRDRDKEYGREVPLRLCGQRPGFG